MKLRRVWPRVISLAILSLCLLCGCGESGSGNRIVSGNEVTPMPKTEASTESAVSTTPGDASIVAALVGLDSVNMRMIVKDLDSGSNYVLSYNGGTDVKNAFDGIITMQQIEYGEIVDVTFDEDKKKAKTVYINKDAFRTPGVTGFRVSSDTKTITYGSASYAYTDNLVVISDGQILAPTEVLNRDVVTVRGFDNKIYSVTVDKGHGYLTFTGAEGFVGGMVEIGTTFLYTIEDNMMIVVPEGEYEVVMTNKDLEGRKTVYITKDMTVTLDFSEYHAPATKVGMVEFQILPRDAELFIEGNKQDYTSPVELDFGTYLINILSDDYETYTTRLIVDSTYQVKTYDLSKIYADKDTTNPVSTTAATTATTTTAATTKAATTAATTATTATTAANNTGSVALTINEPAGASVYIDNVYVGTAPVTVNKNLGEYVVTFRRTGYITKSYIVDVDSADGAQSLSFPAMSEE